MDSIASPCREGFKAYHRVCSRRFPLDGQSDPLDLYPVGLSADVNVISEGNSGQDSLGVRSSSEMEVPVHAVTCSVTTSTVKSHFTQDT